MGRIKRLAGVVAACAGVLLAGAAAAANVETTAPMPLARADHAAVLLTHGRVLVLGGETAAPTRATHLFDPATQSWSTAADLAQPRAGAGATLLLSGEVLVSGGADGAGVTPGSERYDSTSNTWRAAAAMQVARRGHTSTRLPSGDVLVVGGVDATGTAQLAESYAAATDTWSPSSMTVARTGHTATLMPSGDVMIVGGAPSATGTTVLASSERYSAAGSWATTADLTTARRDHTATALPDGRLLVAGGASATGATASVEIYNPGANAWTAAAPLPEARQDHTASLTPDGRVLVTGGSTTDGSSLATSVVYDPATNTWAPLPALGTARQAHSATWLPDGSLLLLGGRSGATLQAAAEVFVTRGNGTVTAAGTTGITGNITRTTPLPSGRVLVAADGSTSARLFDPADGSWTSTGPMSAPRSLATFTLLPNGEVLAVGGSSLDTAELYDEASNTWRPAAPMSTMRRAHQSVLMSSGRVLAISGFQPTGQVPQAEIYDPVADSWSLAAPPLVPRHYASATLLPDGRVLLVGGRSGTSVISHAELYDPVANTWTATGALLHPRNGHMATLLHSGKVLVTGGSDLARNAQPVAELYDPQTGTWTPAGTLATARENHTATLLPSGRVLVAGGFASIGVTVFFAQAELYDPVGNRWLPATSLAGARAQHDASLLPDGRVLLAGGVNSLGFVVDAALFDEGLTPDPGRRPIILSSNIDELPSGGLTVTGTGFAPSLGASHGASNASPTNAPVLQVQRIDNGQIRFVQANTAIGFTDTSFAGTAASVAGLPGGPVRVRAWVNGIPGPAVQTRRMPPGPITAQTATGGVLRADLQWAHANPGDPPTTYDITVSNGTTASCTAPCTAIAIPLPAGSYTFTLRASNADGAAPEVTFDEVTVSKDAVALTVMPGTTTPVIGEPVAVAVTLAAATSPDFAPTGGVLLTADSGSTCTIATFVDGEGACDLVFPSIGEHEITASYAGDANFEAGSAQATVAATGVAIAVTPANVPTGRVAQVYGVTFIADGGTPPYSFAIDGGAVPNGLALSPDGLLSGTPRDSGTFAFDVEAVDDNGSTGRVAVSLTIAPPTLSLAPSTLPPATAGDAYSQAFSASGGIAPYSYALAGGTLPDGLDFVDGLLAGTPTQAGSFPLRIRATDSSGGTGPASVEIDVVLTVSAPDIELTLADLPDTQVGQPYVGAVLTASGGTAPYTFAVVGGALPDGLTLAADGTVSGTATAAGSAAFTVEATDANGFRGTRDYVLDVAVASSTVSVTSSRNPSAPGEAVTFAIAVTQDDVPAKSDAMRAAKAATGTVTITDGATLLATLTLDGQGEASFTTAALDAGTHTLVVRYEGDANTAPSQTQIVQQVVGGAAPAPMPQTIPTLGEWSLLSLLVAIGLLGAAAMRRRG